MKKEKMNFLEKTFLFDKTVLLQENTKAQFFNFWKFYFLEMKVSNLTTISFKSFSSFEWSNFET